jgi:hypothetical protein
MVVSYSDGDQTTNATPYGNAPGAPTGPLAPTDPTQQSGYDVDGNGTVGDSGDVWSTVDFGHGVITGWMDLDGNGYLSDDEKDIDGDGLSNYEEEHGPLMAQSWWASQYPNDGTYPLPYAGTNWLNPDTDGDGTLDGADDQDNDGYTNIEEVFRGYAMPRAATSGHPTPNVNPFNPCYPNEASPTCMTHPPFNPPFGPFNPASAPATWTTWPAP